MERSARAPHEIEPQLNPAKVPVLQRQISNLVVRANLDSDIDALLNRNTRPEDRYAWDPTLTEEGAPTTMESMRGKNMAHLIRAIDGYLRELTGAQIRDGLHILGSVPEGDQLVEQLAQLKQQPGVSRSRTGFSRRYPLCVPRSPAR